MQVRALQAHPSGAIKLVDQEVVMSVTQQLAETLGIGDVDIARKIDTVRRAGSTMTSRFPQKPPALPYFWVGLMIAAASLTAVAVWRRARISRVSRGRRVKDVMVRDVVAVPPSIMLLEAARVMRDANVGVLPVVEDGILRGVVTDRDLVVRAMAQGANPESTLVGECATQDVVSARPDTDIEQAMKLMARCQIGRLPVVDENDRLLGIVTLSSVALRSREDHETLDTAKEVSRRSARAA